MYKWEEWKQGYKDERKELELPFNPKTLVLPVKPYIWMLKDTATTKRRKKIFSCAVDLLKEKRKSYKML